MTDLGTSADLRQDTEIAGKVGFAAVVLVAVVLGIHPFGTTSLYDDGEAFLDHVGSFWIVLHIVGTLGLLFFPLIIDRWSRALVTPESRLAGRTAFVVSIVGMGVGVLHTIATDTMTFVTFSDTFEASGGSEAGIIAVDLLLRLHASTLTAWVMSFWLATPLALGVASFLDRRQPRWMAWLAWAAGALQIAAISITISERQWTTLSEQVVFRTGATLFFVWMLVATWWMRRGAIHPQRTSVGA